MNVSVRSASFVRCLRARNGKLIPLSSAGQRYVDKVLASNANVFNEQTFVATAYEVGDIFTFKEKN